MRDFMRVAIGLMACVAVGGCVVDGPSSPDPVKATPAPREVTHPVKLMVSPLTRVGLEGIGGPSLMLHLDFRDADDRSVKAFGQLRVELFQPNAAGDGKQALARSWDADLSDPLRNALTFDAMITRTYTITLTGVPEWLVQWSRKQGESADAPNIIVQFMPAGTSDASKMLRVAYTLTR
ncbi:MAG TPA: hypothetical protein PKE29_06390 [Phycisphaerales bacterium]|nr:hypothetical protein [Phycisphaerales bacterium]